jgi:hypothetical protein
MMEIDKFCREMNQRAETKERILREAQLRELELLTENDREFPDGWAPLNLWEGWGCFDTE